MPPPRDEELRFRVRRALVFGLGGLASLLAAPALAHDPLDRIKRGDYNGFLDDALRTGWVNATVIAGVSGALAIGIRRGLGDTPATHDLEQAIQECRERAADMQKRRDDLAKQLQDLEDKLNSASRLTTVYHSLNNFTNVAELASLGLLLVELGAAAGLCGGTTGIGGAAAYTTGSWRLANLLKQLAWEERNVARLKAAGEAAYTAARAARNTPNAVLMAERLERIRREYYAAKDKVAVVKHLIDEVRKVIAGYSRVTAGAEAAIAGGAAANTMSSNTLLGWVRECFGSNSTVDEYRKRIDALRNALWQRKQGLFQLEYELAQQIKHCNELAAQLAQGGPAVATAPAPQGGS